jgi:hypothetical protein
VLPRTFRAAIRVALCASTFLFLRTIAIAQSPTHVGFASEPSTNGQHSATVTSTERPVATWSRVYIKDPYVRDAVNRALRGASGWLQRPQCQVLLTEFSDERGRPLTARLAELKMTIAEYVTALIVEDGETHAQCGKQGVLAFTVVGDRMIHVCGRAFARAAQRDAEEARAAIVHELLHSLGLGENPPSPRQITYRVKELCW